MEQVIIGVDPHKLSATIEVVDHHERVLASGRFATDKAGYAAMRRHVAARRAQGCPASQSSVVRWLAFDVVRVASKRSPTSSWQRWYTAEQAEHVGQRLDSLLGGVAWRASAQGDVEVGDCVQGRGAGRTGGRSSNHSGPHV